MSEGDGEDPPNDKALEPFDAPPTASFAFVPSPKSLPLHLVDIVIKSIVSTGPLPLKKSPLTESEAAPVEFLPACKSPKSVAFPVLAIVMNSNVSLVLSVGASPSMYLQVLLARCYNLKKIHDQKYF